MSRNTPFSGCRAARHFLTIARGVIINNAYDANLKIFDFTPLEVKLAVTGYGRAEKEQVRQMVCRILSIEKKPALDDTSDALAIALTACYTNPKLFINQ